MTEDEWRANDRGRTQESTVKYRRDDVLSCRQ